MNILESKFGNKPLGSSRKKTIIFDLDGTLCDIKHRLPFIKGEKKDYDSFFKACTKDVAKWDVIEFFLGMQSSYNVIIVSGRSDAVRKETEEWLTKTGLFPDKLIMRKAGDYTPDHELKRRWLNEGLLGEKSKILATFDDRQRVVDMWRSEGITCLQVDKWEE